MPGTKKSSKKKMPRKKRPTPIAEITETVVEVTAAGVEVTSASVEVTAEDVQDEGFESQISPQQCLIWRQGEFRRRVTEAVAEWAQEPVANILPTRTLGQLAKGVPWNIGQQARLVQSVIAHDVFAPPFPETTMRAPNQLFPSSTTVAVWERIVWRHQNPLTPCFAVTD